MGDAAYGFPTLDETGASILDDFDPDCPESSILQDPNITRAQYDVAYTGTGMESDCCDGSVVPVGGMTHGQQVPRHLFRYPSPSPLQLFGQQHDVPGTPRQRAKNQVDHTLPENGQEQYVPNTVHGDTSCIPTPQYSLEIVADSQLVQASDATLVARRALQQIDHLRGPSNASTVIYPLTQPDSLPESLSQWVVQQPDPTAMAHVAGLPVQASTQIAGSFQLSTSTLKDSVSGHANNPDAARRYPCRVEPCKPDGSFAAFPSNGERNKHERHAHGEEEDKPHRCPHCQKGFDYPNDVERHIKAKHTENPTRLPCLVSSCLKTYPRHDHVRRHVKSAHPREWLVIKDERKTPSKRSSSTMAFTPSTPSAHSTSDCGLLTPPPTEKSYNFESVSMVFQGDN